MSVATAAPLASPAALAIEGVTCSFASAHEKGAVYTAVRDVHFTVGSGEFVSIVGPTGSGKSTILNVIADSLPRAAPWHSALCVDADNLKHVPSTGMARMPGVPMPDPQGRW